MPNKEKKIEIEKEPIDIFEIKKDKESFGKEESSEKREAIEIGAKVEKSEKPTAKTPFLQKTEEIELAKESSSETKIDTQQIENILEENLKDIYSQIDDEHKKIIKEEGEKIASKIEILLKSAKDKSKEILNLILGWLKLMPGVNKFFLEKEAKIKADQIINLKDQGKRRE